MENLIIVLKLSHPKVIRLVVCSLLGIIKRNKVTMGFVLPAFSLIFIRCESWNYNDLLPV